MLGSKNKQKWCSNCKVTIFDILLDKYRVIILGDANIFVSVLGEVQTTPHLIFWAWVMAGFVIFI